MKALIKKLFSLWLNGADFPMEQKINYFFKRNLTRTSDVDLLFDFWNRRPTRLFDLFKQKNVSSSQHFFSLLDLELSRLLKSITWNYYGEEKLEMLSELAFNCGEKLPPVLLGKKMAIENGIVFPLLVLPELGNAEFAKSLPDVIFSDFSRKPSFKFAENTIFNNSFLRLSELFGKFFSFAGLQKRMPLAIFSSGISDYDFGNSYHMALLTKFWLDIHHPLQIPFICCTGAVDWQTGKILPVSGVKKKVMAAVKQGFSRIFIPCANLKDLEFCPENLVAFDHVEELFHWLLLNLNNLSFSPVKNKISRIDALSNTGFVQSKDSFSWQLFFTRESSKCLSPEDRLEKIKCFSNARSLDPGNNFPLLSGTMPEFIKFAVLPELLMHWVKKDAVKAEGYYLEFCRALAGSSSEVFLASRFIRRHFHYDLIRSAEFNSARKRFPLIDLLFFREPVEILHYFSLFEFVQEKDIRALETVSRLLSNDVADYCRITLGNHCAEEIFRQVSAEFFPGLAGIQCAFLVMRKRLPLLFQTLNNFKGFNRGFPELLRKELIDLCRLLIDLQVKNYLSRQSLELGNFSEIDKIENLKIESMLADPVLRPLAKEIGRFNNKRTSWRIVSSYTKDNSIERLKWLPNPALVLGKNLFQGLENSNPERVLNAFSRQFYQEPAGELMTLCIAHWSGMIRFLMGKKISSVISSKKFQGKFFLAFLLGYFGASSYKENECEQLVKCLAREIFQNQQLLNSSISFLLLMLPGKCQKCLSPYFISEAAKYCKSHEEIKQKDRVLFSMVFAILSKSNDLSDRAGLSKFWMEIVEKYEKSPQSVRKISMALMPVFFLLTKQREKALVCLGENFNSVNRSFFAHEYFRCFILKESLFNPGNWHNQFEKQIFDSLALGYFKVINERSLRDYIIHCVSDQANLKFGLELLNDNLVDRQPP